MQHTADARVCEQITQRHARTFSLASRLLPQEKRRAAFALYAFCRIADDLVDLADSDNIAAAAMQLRDYRAELVAALRGSPGGPVFREVARVTQTYGLSAAPLFELLDGVQRDLRPTLFQNWMELEAYCQGVASSVGEMCTHVFGLAHESASLDSAVRHARTLGVAMQLTNILRDVGEDARRGRCYLPVNDLARFGLSPHAVLTDPTIARGSAWQSFMTYQVARARVLYESARPGIALLAPDARRCAAACALGYEGILGAIEDRRYDTISGRSRLGSLARLRVLWRSRRYGVNPPIVSAEEHPLAPSLTQRAVRESLTRAAVLREVP